MPRTLSILKAPFITGFFYINKVFAARVLCNLRKLDSIAVSLSTCKDYIIYIAKDIPLNGALNQLTIYHCRNFA